MDFLSFWPRRWAVTSSASACGQQPRLYSATPITRLEDLAGAHADRPNDMLGCYPKIGESWSSQVFRFVVRSPAGRRRVTLRCAILAYPGS